MQVRTTQWFKLLSPPACELQTFSATSTHVRYPNPNSFQFSDDACNLLNKLIYACSDAGNRRQSLDEYIPLLCTQLDLFKEQNGTCDVIRFSDGTGFLWMPN